MASEFYPDLNILVDQVWADVLPFFESPFTQQISVVLSNFIYHNNWKPCILHFLEAMKPRLKAGFCYSKKSGKFFEILFQNSQVLGMISYKEALQNKYSSFKAKPWKIWQ